MNELFKQLDGTRRIWRWLLFAGFTGALSAAPAAGQNGAGMQFVCLDLDAAAITADGLAPSSGSPAPSLQEIADRPETSHCWVWNQVCPPRRITPAEARLSAGECEPSGDLTVRLSGPGQANLQAADTQIERQREFELTAAPAAMWREVPRRLLPTTRARSPAVSVPRSPEYWRIQARTDDHASQWQDVGEGQDTVDLALAPSTESRFLVTADGNPLPDARFCLVWPGQIGRPEMLGFEVSDYDGDLVLLLPTAGALPSAERTSVIVSHDLRAAVAFRDIARMPATIELTPGLTVTGQLVTDAGEAVAGARLRGLSFVQDGFGAMQRHRGRTGADGRFEIGGFSAGAASLQTEDEGDLGFARRFELDGPLDLGAVVLRSREVAWVRPVDARDGSPVANAWVQDTGGATSAVDDVGLVRVSLDFGRNLSAGAPGYLNQILDLPFGVGLTELDPYPVSLTSAFTVEGVFLAADGVTPATDGQIKATGNRTSRSTTVRSRGLQVDGSFSFRLPAGAWELELAAGNAGTLRLDVQGAEGEVRDLGILTAPPTAWVRGWVVGAEDGAPVQGARISYTRPSIVGHLFAPMTGDVASVTTDRDGHFQLHGLEAGSSTLRVEADGFAPRKLQIEEATVQGVDLDLVELSRGRRVAVRSDVDDGIVALDVGGTGIPQDRLTARLVAGRATFEAVPEEPFGTRVLERGDPVCETFESDATGDSSLTCNRSAVRVAGLVTRGGQPADGMLLWSRRAEVEVPEGFGRHRAGPLSRTEIFRSTQAIELEAPLDREGRYRLESVLPGEWEVLWAPLGGGMQDVRTVTVPEARTATLDFRYEGVSVEGTVTDPDGQPAAAATVTVFPSSRSVIAGPDGRFRVLGLQPGSHQLRARLRHMVSPLVDARLDRTADREVVHLTLEHDPANDELAITIPGSGFCFVETATSVPRMVRMNGGGGRTKLLPPHRERLRIACRTDGRWVLDGWRDLRQALEDGVAYDPTESTAALALVGDPTPPLVEIIGPGGWDLGKLRIWFDGAATFRVGETIPNLPVGEYTLRWNGQTRTVRTERRRTAEVEIEDF